MNIIPTFDGFINEGKVSIGKMNFFVRVFNDAKGLYV